MKTEFKDIAAYGQEDFQAAIDRITTDKQFFELLQTICHEQLKDQITPQQIIASIGVSKNQRDLDNNFTVLGLKALAQKLCTQFTLKGTENIHFPALYISNHRDIILDAAFLSVLINDVTHKRIFFGAGTNLFVAKWIEDMIRINNGYCVIRGGGIHEMMNNSKHLSAYIHHLIMDRNEGVWIAQREGRAKDSDDRTQPAVLKMLTMAAYSTDSSKKDFISQAKELNITPVSISYEYDPCDYLKAQEMQLKRDNPGWKKSPADDFLSMQNGMLGFKGRTIFTIAPSITPLLDSIPATSLSRNEQIEHVATLIDKTIHKHYNIYNVNRIAHDLYLSVNDFANVYTEEEKSAFVNYIQSRIEKISIENKDVSFLKNKLLQMYANPLINQLNA